MWPLEDHVADKIVAMYEVHPGDIPSSRVKDLVDLVLIAHRSRVDGATAHAAIQAEVARRRQLGTRVELPALVSEARVRSACAPHGAQRDTVAPARTAVISSRRGRAISRSASFPAPWLDLSG